LSTATGSYNGTVMSVNQFRGSNGRLDGFPIVTVDSNKHAIADNKAVIAKALNSSKDIRTSALRFTITASGKDSVVLSGATINVLSNYS
jgi:hypothetical protein